MAFDISPARTDELEALLPLFAGYQRFYGVERPDDSRNRRYFARFVAPSDDGLLLAARDPDHEPVGFACLHWIVSSVAAEDRVLLGDLFVVDRARGGGVGRALIDAAADIARERGSPSLTWVTALDNRAAQAVYERTGAARSAWFEYELPVR